MVLEQGKPLRCQYELKFVSTDQEVSDLSAPKPENNWCFMELPKDELAALEAGAVFRVQAHSVGLEGNAALCTSTKTYGLEFLENSNSLLVAGLRTKEVGAEGEKEPLLEVFGQVRGQLILKPESGDTTRLKELLRPHAPGAHVESGPEKPTIGALEYEVAASDSELRAALSEGPYVEDNGLWSMVPPRLERDIVDTVVNLVAVNGWSLEALVVNEVFPQVQANLGEATVPSIAVLRKALRSVMAVADAKSTSEATSPEATQALQPDAPIGDGDELRLDQKKVQRFQALALLGDAPVRVRERFQLAAPGPRKRLRVHGAGGLAAAGGTGRDPPLTVAELAAAVRDLSSNENLSEEQVLQLLGPDAYIDEMENTVHRLSASESLPRGPRERLKELFQLTSHWRPERLAELIAPTLGAGQKVDPWLQKYARQVFVQDDSGAERRLLTKKFTGL